MFVSVVALSLCLFEAETTMYDMAEADLDGSNYLNRSYQSGLSIPSTANASSSSKAVLAALRALQDKIRRLEAERSQALDESAQLKHQIKNLEIESEHAKQKENLLAQKSLQETRNAYDRLLNEKSELEIKLTKLEEKNRIAQSSSDEYSRKIRALEDEKHSSLLRIKEMQYQLQQFELQIKIAQSKEKELGQQMVRENKRHDEEIHVLQKRLSNLQEELLIASEDRGLADVKLMELDQLVAQLLAVNEALVGKLSGKSFDIPLTPGITKKIKKKPIHRTSNHQSESTSRIHTPTTSMTSSKVNEVDYLKSLHKMYADIAHQITSKPIKFSVKKHKKGILKSSGTFGSNSSVRSNASNSSSESKKSLTRMSTKKSVSRSNSRSKKLLTPSISFDGNDDHRRLFQPDSDRSVIDYDSYLTTFGNRHDIQNGSSLSHIGSTASNTTSKDIQSVIASLEEEFDGLNRQYRDLLTSSTSAHHDASSADINPNAMQNNAEEIVSVIQKLHRKGEQLRALKSPPR